jgi:hypothetical protein
VLLTVAFFVRVLYVCTHICTLFGWVLRRVYIAAKFSVFCYNVLCDKYATRQLYAYCPSWALDWDYRKQQILKEITTHSSDIILLQEVETREFYGYFRCVSQYSVSLCPGTCTSCMGENQLAFGSSPHTFSSCRLYPWLARSLPYVQAGAPPARLRRNLQGEVAGGWFISIGFCLSFWSPVVCFSHQTI